MSTGTATALTIGAATVGSPLVAGALALVLTGVGDGTTPELAKLGAEIEGSIGLPRTHWKWQQRH